MTIQKFKLLETRGDSIRDRVYVARAEVVTGIFWWKKVEIRALHRNFAGYWFFADPGEFTPGHQVQRLARAWTAQTGQET